jgi:hypothetical protein
MGFFGSDFFQIPGTTHWWFFDSDLFFPNTRNERLLKKFKELPPHWLSRELELERKLFPGNLSSIFRSSCPGGCEAMLGGY